MAYNLTTKNITPMNRHLSIITGISPGKTARLADTIVSVEELYRKIDSVGWSLSWTVVMDGPGVANGMNWPACTKIERLAAKSGSASCINRALALCHPSWVMVLQPTDSILVDGMLEFLSEPALPRVEWAAANLKLTARGQFVTYTSVTPKRYAVHTLARNWSVPFPFHPAALIMRSSALLQIGGWPALPDNEELAVALYVSELGPGVVTAYRVMSREMQRTTKRGKARDMALREDSFAVITAVLNARRAGTQNPGVTPPTGARSS